MQKKLQEELQEAPAELQEAQRAQMEAQRAQIEAKQAQIEAHRDQIEVQRVQIEDQRAQIGSRLTSDRFEIEARSSRDPQQTTLRIPGGPRTPQETPKVSPCEHSEPQ